MSALAGTASEVRDILRRTVPAVAHGSLSDELLLAEDGLGLDSVALVELLLACEDRFGRVFSARFLADPPLTIGKLVAYAGGIPNGGGAREPI